jgi:hypothetical protein
VPGLSIIRYLRDKNEVEWTPQINEKAVPWPLIDHCDQIRQIAVGVGGDSKATLTGY